MCVWCLGGHVCVKARRRQTKVNKREGVMVGGAEIGSERGMVFGRGMFALGHDDGEQK